MMLLIIVVSNLLMLAGALAVLWALKHTQKANDDLYQAYMASLTTLHGLVHEVSRVNARNVTEITKLREQLEERDKLID